MSTVAIALLLLGAWQRALPPPAGRSTTTYWAIYRLLLDTVLPQPYAHSQWVYIIVLLLSL